MSVDEQIGTEATAPNDTAINDVPPTYSLKHLEEEAIQKFHELAVDFKKGTVAVRDDVAEFLRWIASKLDGHNA